MGDHQQEIADYILDQVSGIDFESKDDFNEGAWIEKACKEMGWTFTPQTGGLNIEWCYPITISGARTSVSEDEMDNIITTLEIHADEWAYLKSSDLIALIEEKSDRHYTF